MAASGFGIAAAAGGSAPANASASATAATTPPAKQPPFAFGCAGSSKSTTTAEGMPAAVHCGMVGAVGTATAVGAGSITVSGPGNSKVTFTTNSATTYREGPVTVGRSALTVGDHVIVVSTAASASSSTHVAASVNILLPEVAGKVVTVSPGLIVVQDSQGFWRNVDVSSSTAYQENGKKASASSVKTGSYVLVSGNIAPDHQTLDAVAVSVLPAGAGAKLGAGAFGFGGFGFAGGPAFARPGREGGPRGFFGKGGPGPATAGGGQVSSSWSGSTT